jgi:queuine tRNA-ribosyltransferase
MHPVIGPLAEAEALYLRPSRLAERLAGRDHRPLVLLDVGLGAGSNAISAWRVSEVNPAPARPLEIRSFDCTVGALELALGADHADAFGFDRSASHAGRSLLARGQHETPRTRWRLVLGDLLASLETEPPASADLVYWDPFSPRANPDLWTVAAFRALRRICRDKATVHTYGSATATRAALLLAGFSVGVGPATGAGRETTIAATCPADLAHPLGARWLERLARSSAPFPPDAPPDALDRVGRHPQFRLRSRAG